MLNDQRLSAAPTRELLSYFDAHHKRLLGVPALISGGKDAKLIANVWRTQGDTMTRQLIDDFFASPDPWIRNNGYTVGRFVAEAGKLLARRVRARPQPKHIADWRDECDERHGGRCPNVHFHLAQLAADCERGR